MVGKVEVKCKVLRFEDNPKGGQNVFVECSVGQRVWIKEVWVNYDRPISFEEFKRDLEKIVWPKNDEDNLRYVKEEADKEFTINVKRDVGKSEA